MKSKKTMSDEASVKKQIDAILAAAPKAHRTALKNIRTTVRKAVPEAVEAISYGLPAFKYKGKAVAGYASYKDHCSYFPMSGKITAKLKTELKGFQTSQGGIHFQPDHPLSETC